MTRQHGSALLLVLMITAIMTSVMLLMMSQNNYHTKMSYLIKTQLRERLHLYSVQSQLNFDIMTTDIHITGSDNRGGAITSLRGESFDYDDTKVSIVDKSGLVSLRPLNKDMLIRLLISKGAKKELASEIVDKLDDWQDADGIPKFKGLERGGYNQPYLPSNLELTAKEELQYIFVGHEKLLDDVLPYLSMYASNEINLGYIEQELQKLLYQGKNGSGILPSQIPQGEFSEEEGGAGSYSSGKYNINIESKIEGFNIAREYELIRGLGTYKPFYVVNEVYK